MLALTQAKWVAAALEALDGDIKIEIKVIKTTGDKILDSPLSKIGDKGLFVKEIETALQAKEIDFAVHSVKDLPSVIPDDLTISAIPKREDPGDVLVTRGNLTWEELPRNAVIGTSALRRQSQLLHHRPDLSIKLLRGNVDTRLRKLDEGEYFGIVLARAGLNRLGIDRGKTIPQNVLIPSPGQGALAVEARRSDESLLRLISKLNDEPSAVCVAAERAFLAAMEGGCQVPLGAIASLRGSRIGIEGFVGSPDGKVFLRDNVEEDAVRAEDAGRDLAGRLLARGGKEIIQCLYARDPKI